jgi:hypothetical protein
VAEANSALSIANWHEAVGVPSLLGLDPRAASLLDRVVRAGEGREAEVRSHAGAMCAISDVMASDQPCFAWQQESPSAN